MKKTLPRHDIFKLSKTGNKEKILKATRENKTNHVQSNKDENGKQFQIENNVNEKKKKYIFFKVQKEKETVNLRILYPTKMSLKNEGEIKIHLDIQKLKELICTRFTL